MHKNCFIFPGGPLVYQGAVIGVTSFYASDNCTTTLPTAFTAIQPYIPWIIEKYYATFSYTNPWW